VHGGLHHYFFTACQTIRRPDGGNPFVKSKASREHLLGSIAFSKCGSRGRRVCLETGVGGVKAREAHQVSCVALDLVF
jgi:hypothetical protein